MTIFCFLFAIKILSLRGKKYLQEFDKFNLEDLHKNNPFKVLNIKKTKDKDIILKAHKDLIEKYRSNNFVEQDQTIKADKITALINWAKDKCLENEIDDKIL
jgi:hypothetical protein